MNFIGGDRTSAERPIMAFRLVSGLLVFGVFLGGCKGNQEGVADEATRVVQALFDAAQAEDFDALSALCDPQDQNNQALERLRNLANEERYREEFFFYFAQGRVKGPTLVNMDGTASVLVRVGPEGDQREIIHLVRRNGKWYLSSF